MRVYLLPPGLGEPYIARGADRGGSGWSRAAGRAAGQVQVFWEFEQPTHCKLCCMPHLTSVPDTDDSLYSQAGMAATVTDHVLRKRILGSIRSFMA